ncbi:chordopoxvirus fusion protein [Thermodesulfovibrio sp. TK110]
MLINVEIIEELENLDPQIRAAFLKILKLIAKAIGEVVTREDFLKLQREVEKLTKAVTELAEAQKKSEERLTRLETVVTELAEAQKKSEERLTRLETVVTELAEAQKKSEERLTRLETVVTELAEAQKKSEERLTRLETVVTELAEAQKKSEERLTRLETTVKELAEAQKKTEEELRQLIGEHRKTREQLGGLSHAIGYVLEDRAYKGLPVLLKRDFAVESIEFLRRDYIEISPNRYEEINIFGKVIINDKEQWILGECKTQLKKTDIDSFLSKVRRIDPHLKGKKILITVTYQASPPVRKYAEEKGVNLYFSYEMPL